MTECYECAKLSELLAENTQLRHLVGKQTYHDDFYDCESTVSVDELAKLQAKVDELTAERDKLREKVRHQSRQLTDMQNALENRNEEIKPRWKRDTKKLQAKIDDLTAELKAARQAHAQAEHEAATLREKLERIKGLL